MYPQAGSPQAFQLANQLSQAEALTAQLQQVEQFRRQNEQQEAAIESQRQQIIQQLNRVVSNSREMANQVAQVTSYSFSPYQSTQWSQNPSQPYQPQIPVQWGQPNVAFTTQPNQSIQ
jgi:DNA anti-recombination protein RmuC